MALQLSDQLALQLTLHFAATDSSAVDATATATAAAATASPDVMIGMSPYRAIYCKIKKYNFYGFGFSRKVCCKNGLKVVLKCFGSSQTVCYTSGLEIVLT